MAAVLCNACGDICSGACEVCGHVCTAPCKLCGNLCEGCCHGCEACCQSVSQVLCTSPFSIYVTVATIFNGPPLYMGLKELAGLECRGSQWLVINGVFCLAHCVAAIYMALQIRPSNEGGSTMARAGHLFCYDPWMALYILVLAAFFVWLWTGAIWSLNGKAANGCQDDDHVTAMAVAMGFGWAFFAVGVAALAIGVCCAYCSGDQQTGASYYSNTTTTYYGTTSAAANTTTSTKPGLATDYVHIDAKSAAVPVTPVSSTKQQQHVPTVKATLFQMSTGYK
jgi:hypothetical protein